MDSQKINAKDLINIGLFAAMYIICFWIVGITGYIPAMLLFLPFLIGLIGGIPIMLFVTKTPKFGGLTIIGILVGLLMFATGHGWPVLVSSLVCSLIGDYIMKKGSYKKWSNLLLGYTVFSLWSLGAMYPIYFMRESYFKTMEAGYGSEYTQAIGAIFDFKMIPVIIIGALVGALIGAYIGRRILKKHFTRAGIA